MRAVLRYWPRMAERRAASLWTAAQSRARSTRLVRGARLLLAASRLPRRRPPTRRRLGIARRLHASSPRAGRLRADRHGAGRLYAKFAPQFRTRSRSRSCYRSSARPSRRRRSASAANRPSPRPRRGHYQGDTGGAQDARAGVFDAADAGVWRRSKAARVRRRAIASTRACGCRSTARGGLQGRRRFTSSSRTAPTPSSGTRPRIRTATACPCYWAIVVAAAPTSSMRRSRWGTQSASTSDGFNWSDWGIGIGVGAGIALILGAGLLMGRQLEAPRRADRLSSPPRSDAERAHGPARSVCRGIVARAERQGDRRRSQCGCPHPETPARRNDRPSGETYRRGMPVAIAYALSSAPFLALAAGLLKLGRA